MTFNKWAGSILAALLVMFGLRTLMHEMKSEAALTKPGYDIVVKEDAGAAPDVPVVQVKLAEVLPKATADAGQAAFKPCMTCHTVVKDGPNKVGPNLFGILNRPKAAHEGFAYSAAMKEKGGNWGYEDLYAFLAGPKAYVPGTKMSFAGLKKPEDRAAVIMYLRTLADTPSPLPQ